MTPAVLAGSIIRPPPTSNVFPAFAACSAAFQFTTAT